MSLTHIPDYFYPYNKQKNTSCNKGILMNLDIYLKKCKDYTALGETVSYIPALATKNSDALGVAVCDTNGYMQVAGDFDKRFTLQSISKVFALLLALHDNGSDEVFNRVGMEPTGDPFNSIIKLETMGPARPLNPLINAGAIAVCDLINGKSVRKKVERIIEFISMITGNSLIEIDSEIYESEKESGHRNRALAHFLKDLGLLTGKVDDVLEIYFKQCAILVNCKDLAIAGSVLVNDGKELLSKKELIAPQYCQLAKALMATCGLYDGSGEFAIKAGMPAKSGVSGGILVAVPKKMGIGVFGPALDKKGNSIAGVKLLEILSKKWGLSIF